MTKLPRLILASASPRRSELLRNAAIPFEVQPAHVPEERASHETPTEYAQRLAREKALTILARNPDALVLGADTIVVVDEQVLEKPVNATDAARMLRLLSGRAHEVTTGVCLARSGSEGQPVADVRSSTTQVIFSPLNEDDIRFYISTGEPMDKAGAYGIQGIAAQWIPKVNGDYSNVVGLPVQLVISMIKDAARE